MKRIKRKVGFYWVRSWKHWTVSYWDGRSWQTGPDTRVDNDYWSEVDERQIIRKD